MSEQKEDKKKTWTRSTPKHPLPSPNISYENHMEIIKAYAVVSRDGREPVGYKDFKALVKLHPTIISGNNEFFEDLGLIEQVKGQRGKYLPNEKTIRLYNALKWTKIEEIKAVLKEILLSSWIWASAKQLLDLKGTVSRTELRDKLGYDSEADPKRHGTSLNVLIDYLTHAGLIMEEKGNLVIQETQVPPKTGEHEERISGPSTPSGAGTITSGTSLVQSSPSQTPSPFLVGILISPEMSEEQIRKAIRTIFDELQKLREKNA